MRQSCPVFVNRLSSPITLVTACDIVKLFVDFQPSSHVSFFPNFARCLACFGVRALLLGQHRGYASIIAVVLIFHFPNIGRALSYKTALQLTYYKLHMLMLFPPAFVATHAHIGD